MNLNSLSTRDRITLAEFFEAVGYPEVNKALVASKNSTLVSAIATYYYSVCLWVDDMAECVRRSKVLLKSLLPHIYV